MLEFCYICLESNLSYLKTEKDALIDVKVVEKLRKCVPQLNWNEEITNKICVACLKLLENAYTFYELCITLEEERIRRINLKNEEVDIESFNNLDDNVESHEEIKKCEDSEDEITQPKDFFICYHCNKTFRSKNKLAGHIRKMHDLRKIGLGIKLKTSNVCKMCEGVFKTEGGLRKHTKYCPNAEQFKNEAGDENPELLERLNGNITCHICNGSFLDKHLLKRHIKNVHATEKKFKCEQCEACFVSLVYLNSHKKNHSGERKYVCSFCGKRCLRASHLYNHEKIHTERRAFKCLECNKSYKTSSDLQKHKIFHADKNSWKYECTYCQRKFPLKTNLDAHIKTHTGEKNFQCHICDKKFVNKSVLLRHIPTHSNVKAFKCTICQQGYKQQKSLDIHLMKTHGIGNVAIPDRVKRFFCHMCPKSYYANNKLQKHIRSHTGDRPFKCDVCTKSFVDKSYIKQHMKTAHGFVE